MNCRFEKKDKRSIALFIFFVFLVLLSGCSRDPESSRILPGPAQMNAPGYSIGVPQGSAAMTVVEQKFLIAEPENPAMTLKIATDGLNEPMNFYADGKLTGFDMEFVKRLAYFLSAKVTDQTAAVKAGKIGAFWWMNQ
ncbi:MAG: hypothetical protein ABFC95_07435 [Smithella sp.]